MLLVIHPCYFLQNIVEEFTPRSPSILMLENLELRLLEEDYGNYKDYLQKLYEEILQRRNNCILFLYKTPLPFDVPEEVEIILDGKNGYKKLIKKLRDEKIENVEICGEFLWYYGRSVKPEEIRKIAESLPPEQKLIIENMLENNRDLDFRKLKKIGINIRPFLELFYSGLGNYDIYDGCVKHMKYKLEREGFSVKIIRELCYPAKEPKLNTKYS